MDLPKQTKAQREARARRTAKLYQTAQALQQAKAKRVAKLYMGNQESFDQVMSQFSPEMRTHILNRVLPHLPFEPAETAAPVEDPGDVTGEE